MLPRLARGSIVICGAAAIAATPISPLHAQQADVIRGRVTTEDGRDLNGARVDATAIPTNVSRRTQTDSRGRYTLTFPGGTGDYWITVSAIGFAPVRFELKRVADEDILIGDATMRQAAVTLEEVRVRGERARVSRNEDTDVSGTTRSAGGVGTDPNQAGNLAAMAAALPGVQLVPGAEGNPDQFSVFGLTGDQNTYTLNGMGFSGTDIPRDAATRSALSVSPWDVSRGGFSGAQFGMRTQPGSNFSTRTISSLLNSPTLQWTDRAGRATGAEYSSVSAGGAVSGPFAMDRVFYNAGYQVDRRVGDLRNLQSADPVALQVAGVSADSVARLRQLLGAAGVALTPADLPGARVTDRASALATIDLWPPASTNGQALNATFVGSWNRSGAAFGRYTAMPTTDAASNNWFAALQTRHTNYFGFGVLTETSLGVNAARVSTDPYLTIPAGTVRVSSILDDGSPSIAMLAFGGSPMQTTGIGMTTLAGQNQLSWFSADNKHRLRFSSELRYQSFEQDVTANALGLFAYNSLAELESGTPAAFMRTLVPRVRAGRQLLGGMSIGDSYRIVPDFQLQYGVRVDANRFLSAPARNAALLSAFGVDNSRLPNRAYLSPRVGFAWTYGSAPQLAIARGFTRGPRAVVRGGAGVFQNTPTVQLAGTALSNTGLPEASRQLACVGAAVPTPTWSVYAANPAAIPSACADGSDGSLFARSAPEVSLFDAGFAAQRSVRSNLNWSGALTGTRLMAGADVTYSRNLNQPGQLNLNFDPSARFSLPEEGGRPVYVDTAAIVTGTGSIAPPGSRRSPGFGYVMQQRSDLRADNAQLTLSLQPMTFSTTYAWTLAYVYSRTRDRARGFGAVGSTGGDPLVVEWARAALDSRHQVVYSLSYNLLDWFPLNWTGSFRSGRPFTPLVSGDINGDGFANDRAFVFDPASSTDPGVAAGMQALLAAGPRAARDCLDAQRARVAARNSCQGPWTSTSTLTIAVNPLKLRLPQRVNFALYVNNVLGAADLLLNREGSRRGWGQSADPDATLLYVRGFDRAARRFTYEVNPRFGTTNLRQTIGRNPVTLTAQLRLDVGLSRERQLLTQSLDRGRGRPGAKPTSQELRSLSGALVPANPMALILQQADSFRLTRRQADSLATLNRVYAVALDSLWNPVVAYLAALPESYDESAAYERYRRARQASVDVLIRLAPAVRSLLTPDQRRRLPPFVSSSLDTRYLASVRSSSAGGANMGVLSMLAQMNAMGGSANTGGSGQTIMMHP